MPRFAFGLLLLALCLYTGCAAPTYPDAEVITVTGTIGMRGNAPFTARVLETPDQNLYVLVFDDASPATYTPNQPYAVTGELYADDWNGRPFAHLRVRTLVPR